MERHTDKGTEHGSLAQLQDAFSGGSVRGGSSAGSRPTGGVGSLAPQYVYSTRSPRKNTFKIDDVLGHRMGVTVRRDILAPEKLSRSFKPYCECGAKCSEWFGTLKLAERRWHEPHKVEAERQQQFPV